MTVARGPGCRTLMVRVLPAGVALRERGDYAQEPGGRALEMVNDPDSKPTADLAVLMAQLRLTRAEAALAALMTGRANLTEAGQSLGIARAIARDRLKVLFLKTGVNRQAELIRLIARNEAVLVHSRPQLGE